MKKIHLLTLLGIIPYLTIATPYNDTQMSSVKEQLNSTSINNTYEDTTHFEIAKSKVLIIDNDSTVKVKVIDKTKTDTTTASQNEKKTYQGVDVEILENQKGTRIIVHKEGDTIQHFEMNFDDFDKKNDIATKNMEEKDVSKERTLTFPIKSKNNKSFKGHWSAFEVGLNNYLTADNSISPDEQYMEINTGKSWNFNLNFAQVSLPVYRDRVGFVSGLGIEWSNYHFSNSNTIEKDVANRKIIPKDLSNMALKKNRLQTTYLTAPILLEVQLGRKDSKKVALSGGVIAGLKLSSHTKYKTGDNKEKDKDDFYLNSFRYGYTARIHYDNIGLYFNYYNTPLFMNSKGPELYPFAAGMIFSFD